MKSSIDLTEGQILSRERNRVKSLHHRNRIPWGEDNITYHDLSTIYIDNQSWMVHVFDDEFDNISRTVANWENTIDISTLYPHTFTLSSTNSTTNDFSYALNYSMRKYSHGSSKRNTNKKIFPTGRVSDIRGTRVVRTSGFNHQRCYKCHRRIGNDMVLRSSCNCTSYRTKARKYPWKEFVRDSMFYRSGNRNHGLYVLPDNSLDPKKYARYPWEEYNGSLDTYERLVEYEKDDTTSLYTKNHILGRREQPWQRGTIIPTPYILQARKDEWNERLAILGIL